MNDGVILSGDFSEIRLPTLLMSLYRDRETGVLALEEGGIRKALYIKDGQVVYATSSDPDDRLGESLLRRGLITLAQYEDASGQVLQGNKQGRALVDMGAITPSDLVESVTQQLYDIMFSLFGFRSGTYSLELAPFSTLEMITIAIDIPAVIFKGMSRQIAWSQMRPVVGNPSLRLRTRAELPAFVANLDITGDEEHLLHIAREGMAVSSLLEASYLSQFETLRTLWIFLTLGLMEREDPANRGRAAAAQPEALIEQYNELYSYVYYQLPVPPNQDGGLDAMMMELSRAHPVLAAHQTDLARFGRLDVDQALVSLRAVPEANREGALQAFLEEALYALVLEADRRLPQARREALHAHIRHLAGTSQGVES